MRLAGAVLIIAAASLMGVMLSLALVVRVKKLEGVCRYISALCDEMRHSRAELPEILKRLRGEVYIKDGCWCGTEGLKSEEYAVLQSFLTVLGTTDIEGQINNAQCHLASLENILQEARMAKSQCERLYISLGFLGGIFIAILLI